MTRNSEMLGYAATDLERIRPLLDDALARLHDQRRGQPGSSFGGSGGPTGANSPVENALGLNHPSNGGITPDKAAARITEIDAALKRIVRDLRVIAVIVTAETNQTAPTDKQRREAERENTEQVAECRIMRERSDTFEAAHCESDLGGLLPEPKHVCRWVYDFARKTDRLPTHAECRAHAVGTRVMVRA